MKKFKVVDVKTGDFFITEDKYAQKGDVRGVIQADISHIINSKRGEYTIGKFGTRKRIISGVFKEEFNMISVNIEDAKENTINRFIIENL